MQARYPKSYMTWPERVSEMHPRITNVHVW
jgi:hypothetical protein